MIWGIQSAASKCILNRLDMKPSVRRCSMTNLFIDPSTQALMVALEKDGAIIDATFELAKNDHSTRLMPTIERLFEANDLTTNELSSIYIGAGPGSYTGVRIGVT